jgi:serine/threonine protein kinase
MQCIDTLRPNRVLDLANARRTSVSTRRSQAARTNSQSTTRFRIATFSLASNRHLCENGDSEFPPPTFVSSGWAHTRREDKAVKIAALSCAALALVAGVARGEIVWASYSIVVTLTPGGDLLSVPQATHTIRFDGMHEVELQNVGDPTTLFSGVKNNPLYKDKGVRGENPFHTGSNRATPSAPWSSFDPQQFDSYTSSWTSSAFISSNGVIHRDLAARNILLDTNQGRFASALGAVIVLGADGIDDLRTTPSTGPIRWMPPESLRLYHNADENSNAYFDASMMVEWTVIPSASTGALLGCAALVATRRRR